MLMGSGGILSFLSECCSQHPMLYVFISVGGDARVPRIDAERPDADRSSRPRKPPRVT